MTDANAQSPAFTKLRQFLRTDRTTRSPLSRSEQPMEVCELCSLGLRPQHRHLLEMSDRKVLCACDGCALRFENVIGSRFKLIPRDARVLDGFQMTDLQWAALAVPIDLAFIYYDSAASKRTALYPSPAGVTESLLPLTAWSELAEENPALNDIQADVEALLINRLGERAGQTLPARRPLAFVAPIDKCYELAGLIRLHWHGLSGGEEVWTKVDGFFETLQKYARHA